MKKKKIKVSLRKCLIVVGVKVLEGTELRNRGRVGCLYRYFCSH